MSNAHPDRLGTMNSLIYHMLVKHKNKVFSLIPLDHWRYMIQYAAESPTEQFKKLRINTSEWMLDLHIERHQVRSATLLNPKRRMDERLKKRAIRGVMVDEVGNAEMMVNVIG